LPKYLFNTLLKHSFEKSNFIILHSNQYHFICSNHNKGNGADGMPLQMANIVLKNTKNQPSVPQTVLIILMVFQ
jgi:hypothetical protein